MNYESYKESLRNKTVSELRTEKNRLLEIVIEIEEELLKRYIEEISIRMQQ